MVLGRGSHGSIWPGGLYKTSAGWIQIGAALLAIYLINALAMAQDDPGPERWEPAIQAFESADRQSQPEPGQILFLGSSSIRGWDLEKYFPDLDTINRGFGGSQISDSVYFFDRLVTPYRPRAIVFYAGDNDIAVGKSPQEVLRDYQRFVERTETNLEGTEIIFIAIKPSIRRWHLIDDMREANRLIQEFSENKPHLHYLDIDAPMIGSDGKPRPELFVEDGLHLSHAGYQSWSDILSPLL